MSPFNRVGWASCVVTTLAAAASGQGPTGIPAYGGWYQHYGNNPCTTSGELRNTVVYHNDTNGEQCHRDGSNNWWSIWYDSGAPDTCYGCYRATEDLCTSECTTATCLDAGGDGSGNCSWTVNNTCRPVIDGNDSIRLTCTGRPLCPAVIDNQTCGAWCLQHGNIGGHGFGAATGQCTCGGTLAASIVGHRCFGSASPPADPAQSTQNPPPRGPSSSKEKLSATDDIGIGIGAFVIIAIVAIVLCFTKKGCCCKGDDDGPDEIFLMGKWQTVA